MSSSSIFTTSLWRNLASSSSLKQISAPNRSVCAKCQHTRSWSLQRRRYHSDAESFSDMEAELLRRKRKTDAKRRQGGSEFVDHLIVTVRGGKFALRLPTFGIDFQLICRQGRFWGVCLHCSSLETRSRHPIRRKWRSRRKRLPKNLSASYFPCQNLQATNRRARESWCWTNEAWPPRKRRDR